MQTPVLHKGQSHRPLLPPEALTAQQRQPPCTAAACAAPAPAALLMCDLSQLHRAQSWMVHGDLQGHGPWPRHGRGLQATHVILQGPEDPQVILYAERLADLLGCYTERLEEARAVLLEVLEVSMVSVTLLCCRVPLASPSSLSGS